MADERDPPGLQALRLEEAARPKAVFEIEEAHAVAAAHSHAGVPGDGRQPFVQERPSGGTRRPAAAASSAARTTLGGGSLPPPPRTEPPTLRSAPYPLPKTLPRMREKAYRADGLRRRVRLRSLRISRTAW